MIILGIDPGTTRIGFGVVQTTATGFSCLEYGVITHQGSDRPGYFRTTSQELSRLIALYHPDLAVVERLFFTKNQKTAMAVSEMRGVILLTLTDHGIPVQEPTPSEVKQAISGYGRALKPQMRQTARMILHLKDEIKSDDAADALALALCGALGSPRAL